VPILDARVSISRFGSDSFVIAAGGELEQGGRRILVDLTDVSSVQRLVKGRDG
jgi:hypothetical protein